MISSTSSSSKLAAGLPAAAMLFALWWGPGVPAARAADAADPAAIAILTPADVTMVGAPVDRIAEALDAALTARGFRVLPVAELDAVLERHRERYTGGVSSPVAAAFGEETGVYGILITSVDDWDESINPRVALTCRWVQANGDAPILWIDGAARHALDKPGAFGLGLGKDVWQLLGETAEELASSLAARRDERSGLAKPEGRGRAVESRFRPRSVAVLPSQAAAEPGGAPRRVAVLPFFTDGGARGLGDVFALQFVRHLRDMPGYEVIEPGIVRQALLDTHVIQEQGVSLPQVDAVRALLNVDVVVSGRITEYDGLGLGPDSPLAGFSARAIDAHTRRVIWTSFSYAHGDDGLRLFDTRWVRSGIALTSELVRGVVQKIEKETQEGRPPAAAPKKKGTS